MPAKHMPLLMLCRSCAKTIDDDIVSRNKSDSSSENDDDKIELVSKPHNDGEMESSESQVLCKVGATIAFGVACGLTKKRGQYKNFQDELSLWFIGKGSVHFL
ncbi:hypothetical protein ACFE04_027366 [Oxalis oulophora]